MHRVGQFGENLMRLIAVTLACLMACFLSSAFAETARQEILLDGRSYLIDLPRQSKDAPVILVLHGGGGNAGQVAKDTGFGAPATAKGYAVIYPEGVSRRLGLATWNAGNCCGLAVRLGVDDVAFLDAVIADAVGRFGVDPEAIFVTGMSNGAMMAERYAAARPDRVRGVAGVAGTLDVRRFAVQGAVPLLVIHGTADTHVPFDGGVGPDSYAGVSFTAVGDVIAAFLSAQGIALQRNTDVIDPSQDGMRTLRTDWIAADGRVRVRLLAIEGGGHAWPGGQRAARKGGTTDLNATEEILTFFQQYR
jgi:polyhydroxybutyrate depolymerase